MRSIKFNFFIFIIFPILMFASESGIGQNPLFSTDSSYLSKQDIVYKTPAYEGFEGFPLGNGDMGGMVWNTNNSTNSLDLSKLS